MNKKLKILLSLRLENFISMSMIQCNEIKWLSYQIVVGQLPTAPHAQKVEHHPKTSTRIMH